MDLKFIASPLLRCEENLVEIFQPVSLMDQSFREVLNVYINKYREATYTQFLMYKKYLYFLMTVTFKEKLEMVVVHHNMTRSIYFLENILNKSYLENVKKIENKCVITYLDYLK